METDDEIEARELEHRVFYSLLTLIVRTADRLGFSLKDVTHWVRIAYVKQLKDAGLSNVEVGDRLDVSERTVKSIVRDLRDSFFAPEQEHNLPTQIEFMLWRTPMGDARLRQVLRGVNKSDVDDAVELLLAEGRVEVDDSQRTPVYVPTQSVNSLLSPNWVKRIGGLNSLVSNLGDTVRGRFFDDDPSAFARTLNFLATRDDFEQLEKFFWDRLVPEVASIDANAHHNESAQSVRLSVFWSRTDEGAVA